MIESPFIFLARSFFEHALWAEDRVYSRAEAWLDLVRSAAWKPHRRLSGGVMVEVPRGGIVASERFLSDRWMWSRTKVRAFLDLLKAEKMIRQEKDHGNTLVLLCNFDRYNPQKNHGNTGEEPAEDRGGTKEKEGKEGTHTPRASKAAPENIEAVRLLAARFQPTSTVREKPDAGFIEWWWDEGEKRGWVDPTSGAPWSDWEAAFRASWRAHCHNNLQRNSKTYAPNQRPGGRSSGASGAATLRNPHP